MVTVGIGSGERRTVRTAVEAVRPSPSDTTRRSEKVSPPERAEGGSVTERMTVSMI